MCIGCLKCFEILTTIRTWYGVHSFWWHCSVGGVHLLVGDEGRHLVATVIVSVGLSEYSSTVSQKRVRLTEHARGFCWRPGGTAVGWYQREQKDHPRQDTRASHVEDYLEGRRGRSCWKHFSRVEVFENVAARSSVVEDMLLHHMLLSRGILSFTDEYTPVEPRSRLENPSITAYPYFGS